MRVGMCVRAVPAHDNVCFSADFFGEYGMMGVEDRYLSPNGLPVEYCTNSLVACLQVSQNDTKHTNAGPVLADSQFSTRACVRTR